MISTKIIFLILIYFNTLIYFKILVTDKEFIKRKVNYFLQKLLYDKNHICIFAEQKKNIMKNLIKLSLVALGIISATLVSTSNLFAHQDSDSDLSPPAGYCDTSTNTVCGVSAGGFKAIGFYVTQ